jgi:hypothetical protein
MIQATERCHRHKLTTYIGIVLDFTISRCFFGRRKMRSVFVVATDALIQRAFRMSHIVGDHMIEQIAAAVANPKLCNAVLPRATEAGLLGLEAKSRSGTGAGLERF